VIDFELPKSAFNTKNNLFEKKNTRLIKKIKSDTKFLPKKHFLT
jgi:hypothetical protein